MGVESNNNGPLNARLKESDAAMPSIGFFHRRNRAEQARQRNRDIHLMADALTGISEGITQHRPDDSHHSVESSETPPAHATTSTHRRESSLPTARRDPSLPPARSTTNDEIPPVDSEQRPAFH